MSQQINLYDPALLRKRDWLTLGSCMTAAFLLSAGMGAAGFVVRGDLPALTRQAATNDAQLKALRDQVAALGREATSRKPDPVLEQEVNASRLLLSARAEVLNLLKKDLGPGKTSYTEFLRGFARQSVPGLWLTGFVLEASGGMEIRGRTVDPALLPEYIIRLNREPAYLGRAFSALSLSEGKPDTAVVGGKPVAAGQKAAYHEFRLVPMKPLGDAGKAAMVTQAQAGGGQG